MHIDTAARHCEECQADIGAGDRFCKKCGARINELSDSNVSDNSSTATATKGGDGSAYQTHRGAAAKFPIPPSRSVSKRAVVAGLLTISVVYLLYKMSDFTGVETPSLQVQRTNFVGDGNLLQITNVGSEDVEISDITINDRDECTLLEGWLSQTISPQGEVCKVDADSLPPFIRHAVWVRQPLTPIADSKNKTTVSETADGRYPATKICGLTKFPIRVDVNNSGGIIVKVGETYSWLNTCHATIIRTTIATNHGTGIYHWE